MTTPSTANTTVLNMRNVVPSFRSNGPIFSGAMTRLPWSMNEYFQWKIGNSWFRPSCSTITVRNCPNAMVESAM